MIKGVDQINLTDDPEPPTFALPRSTSKRSTITPVLRFYGAHYIIHTVYHTHTEYAPMQEDYHMLDCSYPASFLSSSDEFFARLPLLSRNDLSSCVRRFRESIPKTCQTKAGYINVIQNDFARQTNQLIQLSTPDLLRRVSPPVGHSTSRFLLVCQFIHDRYGTAIASQLLCSKARWNPPDVGEDQILRPTWFQTPLTQLRSRLAKVDAGEIKSCCGLYLAPDPVPKSKTDKYNTIIQRFRARSLYLLSLSDVDFVKEYVSLLPQSFPSRAVLRQQLVEVLLKEEFGDMISEPLLSLPSSEIAKERKKQTRREQRAAVISDAREAREAYVQAWPQVVPKDVVYGCLNAYYEGSQWTMPPVCCVCSRRQHGVEMHDVVLNVSEELPDYLSILRNEDESLFPDDEFLFTDPRLNGLVLDPDGLHVNEERTTLRVCHPCNGYLPRSLMPRYALANKLYRGRLPEEFRDLTWIEERVCAKFSNTAVVTRLYQSSDPSQPAVFHGNTCAHEMNVNSTAVVLPRAPPDVNGLLSVVFIGPSKFKPEYLGNMYRIRKSKVWGFLQWLKMHNKLYQNVSLDERTMDLYPEDGYLPGIEETVIHDEKADAEDMFNEETAGISEHPAELLNVPSESSNHEPPGTMIEKTGVTDPECDRMPGRLFTSSAIKNLVSDGSELPDLVLHRGSAAVPEYNNPDLLPGMYPTLFPAGVGGFDISDRICALSFANQAKYCLDLADRSFRYHHSFMFVVLNIIQRRTAHLQTHFTVRRSQFESVASKLVAVKSDVLRSVADHLEHEGKYENLSSEQKSALDLLKHVNTIAARIPGSQAAKIFMRNEIRSYCGFFGLPHIYITLNPNAAHSPIFQVMFGDETVDLTKRFPILVSARERAIRLAKDPVAGADFFNFCITCIFQYMFGWDYDKQESTPLGGILGKLEAFYGSSEFTDRGMLHGHFLVWLLGGLNPSDVHQKMRDDPGFQERFFAFFEDIIHHHFPDIDLEVDKSFEPRTERPPKPPSVDAHLDMLNEWESVFCTQIKMCGEILQRHGCRKVCYKYRNDNECRFLFPHEIVEASYFDSETNSIFLLCRDGTVNYLNPYLLVFCRHNHDIKCILSGKAAKAAMFYITDYITKGDLKTHDMLSLLSRAVANLSDSPDEGENNLVRSKRLLHKCLSQFTRQQQIHAQQAARYLRGQDDSIPSHKTTPMLSALLISYVTKATRMKETGNVATRKNDVGDDGNDVGVDENDESDGGIDEDCESDADADEDNYGDREREDVSLKIVLNRDGTLREANQVVDYLYRGETLCSMAFYDFCRCVRLEKTSASQTKNTADTRLGVLKRHELKDGHPLATTHRLVEHTSELRGEGTNLLIPRVVGMSIPRKSDKIYHVFALAHFMPFDIDNPLIHPGQTAMEVFNSGEFSHRHLQILDNWEAIHECQDERDAERMRKRTEQARESRAMTRALHGSIEAENETEIDLTRRGNRKARDMQAELLVDVMRQCHWIKDGEQKEHTQDIVTENELQCPEPTASQLSMWTASIKQQENEMIARRRNAGNVAEQVEVNRTETLTFSLPLIRPPPSDNAYAPATEAPKQECGLSSVAESVRAVAEEFSLNEKQKIVYNIVARKFIDQHILKIADDGKPLRMVMTGPGGTGKTHAVKALQKLMTLHNLQHLIRFLGPTGSSAKQIGGTTIHKGLGLNIALKSKGRGNRKVGEDNEDYSATMNVKNRTLIRNEWRDVSFVFVDEYSLIGAQLLCELDHALRFAKENTDEWFGGINIIFAGDFYQYPPVGSTPLYTPIQPKAPQKSTDIEKRLGRLAWKSVNVVVSLSEQQRMKDDPGYASAVERLRVRSCNLGDMELFNSRVVKSMRHPDGLKMAGEREKATMLVGTNFVRELINNTKAKSACQGELTYCAAYDLIGGSEPSFHDRKHLLGLNLADFSSEGALPGLIPLYVGMPVILRNRNVSTELGITNGSQGVVRKIFTRPCASNYSVARCVIVEFPDSNVQIPHLPPGHFPLTPTNWRFTTTMTDSAGVRQNVHISRSQLNLQPAFAITGHAAQGKTLPQVLVDLHEGGFAAYVSASRARTREGLFLTKTVSLDSLNRPVSSDLRHECRRLERLEYNTRVRHGFETGSILPALDPESEIDVLDVGSRTPPSTTPVSLNQSQLLSENVLAAPPRVRPNPPDNDNSPSSPAGCMWSENSCAYDTFFMIMFSIYRDATHPWKQAFRGMGPLFWFASDRFEHLMEPANLTDPHSFSRCRDELRGRLFENDPQTFPPPGPHHTSICKIFEVFEMNSPRSFTLSQRFTCGTGCKMEREVVHLPNVCSSGNWANAARRVDFSYPLEEASIQLFVDLQIAAKIKQGFGSQCNLCNAPRTCSVFLPNTSPWLFFVLSPGVRPHPQVPPTLEINGEACIVTYRLSAMVYYDGTHFTGVWTNKDNSSWSYDGLARGGRPERLQPTDLTMEQDYTIRNAHVAIYSLDDFVPPS